MDFPSFSHKGVSIDNLLQDLFHLIHWYSRRRSSKYRDLLFLCIPY